jgi:DNA modification methylase
MLYHGDCVEIMSGFADGCVDLTVTSPPYDDMRAYKGHSFDFETTAQQLYRVTKDGGIVVWVVGDQTKNGSETGTSFRQALYFKDVCGFNLYDTMFWEKLSRAVPTEGRYYSVVEYMFVLSKGRPKTINFIEDHRNITVGSRRQRQGTINKGKTTYKQEWYRTALYSRRSNLWSYSVGLRDEFSNQHPAPFPEALARDHILSWSNEGDTVLDCFMGSGTTGKMAIETRREFIGIEIAREYYEIAQRRIAESLATPRTIRMEM